MLIVVYATVLSPSFLYLFFGRVDGFSSGQLSSNAVENICVPNLIVALVPALFPVDVPVDQEHPVQVVFHHDPEGSGQCLVQCAQTEHLFAKLATEVLQRKLR